MRSAAEREDATEKNAVTPGPLAPARELLGDLLIAMKEPAQALKEYEAALTKEPNRFRTLYGAGHAAALAGDGASARKYFQQLVKISAQADKPERPEILEARRFLATR
jgi:tetratricopeptide (TPR) repeat protein